MAGASDDHATSICSHCGRAIPSSNIDLHFAHCSRNLEKCKVCGDMVPKKFVEEHFLGTHAQVSCSLCSETMDRSILDVHKREIARKGLKYVGTGQNYAFYAINILDSERGMAMTADALVLLITLLSLQGISGHLKGPKVLQEGKPHEFSPKRLLFTIAITGIAVLLGKICLFGDIAQMNDGDEVKDFHTILVVEKL
ncbi:hypothetical protein Sango_2074400 [Sesamum angolense]|uniref:Uncharacterized protein n=1 Tax=Sesamum angolense TaxID=2727404 RepID=A0AAE2BLT2_9LAMI|nr:hypothetical protein Sango_2074400 [Sesamum angolense]